MVNVTELMDLLDLATLDYQSAWNSQERVHAQILDGTGTESILFVEHPPVITFGRRAADSAMHLVASREMLKEMGVDVVESDRGGDITFHGPGQLVAYPIVRLNDHQLSVGGYVKALEHAVIGTLGHFGIEAFLDPGAIGVWVRRSDGTPAKVCALGVRIKRGISMHGIALNVATDLRYFELIVPCGLTGRPVTSMQQLLGERCPSMVEIKPVLAKQIETCVTTMGRHNTGR